MKNILTIIFRLTVACLLAGLVMGAAFIATSKAKKHNIHVNEQKVMLSLLGFSAKNPAPDSVAMHEVYRYLVGEGEELAMGYLLPLQDGSFSFVTIDLAGGFVAQTPVTISPEKAVEEGERTQAVGAAIGAEKPLRYADQTIVVTNDGKRMAYLLPGKFPGFKTFIGAMLALDQDFSIRGLEIMEHEEDPGLGAEIDQDYFKNQFKGKPLETVKKLEVKKTPLPEEYLKGLEAGKYGLGADEVARIQEQYQDDDIYALTGATISSSAVTNGIKAMVKKFAYRVAILDRVLAEQHIATPF
ncbi:MAG: FMN-binding protein [Desulfurivibrionaceae bacterium]|jgi:electron transport complex protein RnfG|nr:FMN-binding protein [Pseudomonadota bacterium]MCG2822633.1 FMN-binding protein [Desulfobulbaceae bacterium]MDP2003626.1 FMN-binding protein [Desulfurivibrionaceae bacterium]PKN22330.1 MAG: FMN-binding protein [Deltaproteobacteria bacterium HGW-Deltaproteobacteria-3]MBU4407558.1 FMN-binding protein [Pseudomonadota bacterium]